LIDLEEVINPPLTSLSLVVPSFYSTPIAASVSHSTLVASPLSLARCTGRDEISAGDVSVLGDDSLS